MTISGRDLAPICCIVLHSMSCIYFISLLCLWSVLRFVFHARYFLLATIFSCFFRASFHFEYFCDIFFPLSSSFCPSFFLYSLVEFGVFYFFLLCFCCPFFLASFFVFLVLQFLCLLHFVLSFLFGVLHTLL